MMEVNFLIENSGDKKKLKVQVTRDSKKIKHKLHLNHKLNDLSGTDWIKFTRSWFIEDGKVSEITKEIESHPASFPPSMIKDFILFFTKTGEKVLDMFLGTRSTLVTCDMTGRIGVGIE